MICNVKNVIKITQESKEDIAIRLEDTETGERVDLSLYESGKVIFKNSAGVSIVKTISFPIADPSLGVLRFTLSSVDTVQFDCNMRSFEVELIFTGGIEKTIITLEDSLFIKERL
jgi:hypothetical protein